MMAPPAVEGFKARTQSLEKIGNVETQLKQAKKERDDVATTGEGSNSALQLMPKLQEQKALSLSGAVESQLEGVRKERAEIQGRAEITQEKRRGLKERTTKNEQRRKALELKQTKEAQAAKKKDAVPLDPVVAEKNKLKDEQEKKEIEAEAASITESEQLLAKGENADKERQKPLKDTQTGLLVLLKLVDRQPWLQDPTAELEKNIEQARQAGLEAEKKVKTLEQELVERKKLHEQHFEQIDPEAKKKHDELKKAKEQEQPKQPADDKQASSKKPAKQEKAPSPEQLRKIAAGKRDEYYKFFEADLRDKTARELEQRLAELKAKINNAFPDQPPEAIAECPVGAQLQRHVAQLESEIDKSAHKAPCHKCKQEKKDTVNGVDRPEQAKALIFEKVKELDGLKEEPGDSVDHKLAHALKSMAADVDENGQTAGQMLGVLICETPDKQIVFVYGYSGTVRARWRVANANVVALERFLGAADREESAKRDIEEVNNQLKGFEKNKAQYEQALLEIDKNKDSAVKKADEELAGEKKEAQTAQDEFRAKLERERDSRVQEAKLRYQQEAGKGMESDVLAKAEYTKAFEAAEDAYRKGVSKAQQNYQERVGEATERADALKQKADLFSEQQKADAKAGFKIAEMEDLEKKKKAFEKEQADSAALAKKQKEAYPDPTTLKAAIVKAQEELDQASKVDAADEQSMLEVSPDGGVVKWAPSLPVEGALQSKSGDQVSLASLNKDHEGTPHGVCSAPKMIQYAHKNNLKVLAMAEAWFGKGTNDHGELVASCNTCMKNIGFQLCEQKHEH